MVAKTEVRARIIIMWKLANCRFSLIGIKNETLEILELNISRLTRLLVILAIIVRIRKVSGCQAGLSQIKYPLPYPHREGIKPNYYITNPLSNCTSAVVHSCKMV